MVAVVCVSLVDRAVPVEVAVGLVVVVVVVFAFVAVVVDGATAEVLRVEVVGLYFVAHIVSAFAVGGAITAKIVVD